MKEYLKNCNILKDRKEIKQMGHQRFRKHFLVLAALMLIMIMFGTEYAYVLTSLKGNSPIPKVETSADEESEISGNLITASDLLQSMILGELAEQFRNVLKLKDRLGGGAAEETPAVQATRGELAKIINTLTSGELYMKLGEAIYSITKSESVTGVVFIIISFLIYLLLFFLIKRLFSAMIRRPYLEACLYEKVSIFDTLHFAAVRSWLQAAWTMAVCYVLHFLWKFTVIGGFIKEYSYFAVPYIVAENPRAGALEAVTLSRKMMDGHKMELFLFQLSFVPWFLLMIVTAGFSDLFYGASYRLMCETEFYRRIREEAKEKGIDGIEILDDRYLYEKADRIELTEAYFDIVDEITLIYEQKFPLKKVQEKLSEWLGVWIGTLSDKKKYDDLEGMKYTVSRGQASKDGQSYPLRLNPRYVMKESHRKIHFNWLRSYSVWTLVIFFILFSVIGWTWEVALHYMQVGEFANRGTLFGPWLPIYGTGGVVVLMLCARFRRNPALEFVVAVVLCGTIEYFSGWYLETKFHVRWWSYDGYFLNLHGRICAEGLLVFGVACCLIVYLIAPVFDFLLSRIKPKILIVVSICLAVLFGVDAVRSSAHPNMAVGAIEEEGQG